MHTLPAQCFISAQSQLSAKFSIINPCADKHAWTETSPGVPEFALPLTCNNVNLLLGKEMTTKSVVLVWVLNMGNTIFCERLHDKQKCIVQFMISGIPSPECHLQILIKPVFSFSHGILHASYYNIRFGSWGIIPIKFSYYIHLKSID